MRQRSLPRAGAVADNFSSRFGFAVGNRAWMDGQNDRVARYWRAIEYGSDYWVGRQVAGLWGNSPEPRGNLHSTATSFFGEGAGQKFVPFFGSVGDNMSAKARAAYFYARRELGIPDPRHGHHGKSDSSSFPTLGTIRRPIAPARFYERALEAFDAPAEERQALRKAFNFANSAGYTTPRQIAQRYFRGAEGAPPALNGGKELSAGAFRKGAGAGFALAFTISGPAQGLSRNALGHFSTFQRELIELNRILARRLQEAVVAEAEASIKRKDVSTGRLVEALAAPQNRFPQ